jgi:hypothetical protein
MADATPKLPRVQTIVLPILRAAFADYDRPVTVGSWTPDIDYRDFPLFNVKRLGGAGRNSMRPTEFGLSVIELTCYDTVDLPTTENLYDVALEALYKAWRRQTQTPYGYLSSIKETMGATPFGSPFQDSWRVQGLIQLGIRPPRS